MKKIYYSVAILTVALLLTQCKKEDDENTPPVSGCNSEFHFAYRSDSFAFTLPTAFTPNGDGKNDIYLPVTNRADITEYQIKVIDDATNSIVFQSSSINVAWGGSGSTGYSHTVLVRFKDPYGNMVDTCSHVWKLDSGIGGCVKTKTADAHRYVFIDEIDPETGGAYYNTGEVYCP